MDFTMVAHSGWAHAHVGAGRSDGSFDSRHGGFRHGAAACRGPAGYQDRPDKLA